MKDIHGNLIRRGDLVCADDHTRKTIYYVKDCRTTLEDEVFDVCRITKDYHIDKRYYDKDERIKTRPVLFDKRNIERIAMPDTLKQEIEDAESLNYGLVEKYGKIIQKNAIGRHGCLYRVVQLSNGKYGIIQNLYSREKQGFDCKYTYWKRNILEDELNLSWERKKKQDNCIWRSY